MENLLEAVIEAAPNGSCAESYAIESNCPLIVPVNVNVEF